MTELAIAVVSSQPDPYAAVPTLLLRLRIETPEAEPVHAMVLKAQIRIEPQRRRYSPEEEARLLELFGESPQWGESLRPFLWTHVTTTVAEFTGSVEIDLPVPCTYDFEVAAAKYLHSIGDGEIPIVLLFNGTIFSYRDGGLDRAADRVARRGGAPPPGPVWRATMDGFFPNSGWIRLRRRRSTPSPATRPIGPSRPGRTPSSASSRRRTSRERRPLRAGPARRRRRAVRGLRAVPVPGVGGQEPGALAVRRAHPEGLQRGRRLRGVDDADRVPARVRARGRPST